MKLFPLSGNEPDATARACYRLYDMKDAMTAVIPMQPPGRNRPHGGAKTGFCSQSPG